MIGDPGGFNVRNAPIERLIRVMLNSAKSLLPGGWGVTVMLFNFGENEKPGEGLFYGSTANRDDMIRAMKEFIAKNEH